jgi:hypothetical protein
VAGGGLGWHRGAVGFLFWRLGQQVDTGDEKEEEREQQGNTEEGRGKWLGACVGWAWGGQGGAPGRTRELSGPTHFGLKSETRMDARGHVWTALFVWVAPLDRVLYPRRRIRTRGGRMGRPAGDALSCFYRESMVMMHCT